MLPEINVATQFIISHLYNKLPRRRVDAYGLELDSCISAKFQGHWYPEEPFKDVQYRCLRVCGEHVDPVMFKAAEHVGLDISEIFACFPSNDLTIWIDPAQVSYRVGPKGQTQMLLDQSQTISNPSTLSISEQLSISDHLVIPGISTSDFCDSNCLYQDSGFGSSLSTNSNTSSPGSAGSPASMISSKLNPDAPLFLPFSDQNLSSALQQQLNFSSYKWSRTPQSTSSTSAASILFPPSPYLLQRSQSAAESQFITAAAFAQTKFGSTKLKSQAKRPSRLSPSESSNGVNLPTNYSSSIIPPHQQPLNAKQQHIGPSSKGFGQSFSNSSIVRSISLSPSVVGATSPTEPSLNTWTPGAIDSANLQTTSSKYLTVHNQTHDARSCQSRPLSPYICSPLLNSTLTRKENSLNQSNDTSSTSYQQQILLAN